MDYMTKFKMDGVCSSSETFYFLNVQRYFKIQPENYRKGFYELQIVTSYKSIHNYIFTILYIKLDTGIKYTNTNILYLYFSFALLSNELLLDR